MSGEEIVMTVESVTVWVCTDCHLALAGYSEEELGYRPEREPLSLLADVEVTSGMGSWAEHADDCPNRAADEWVAECDCEHRGFSWSQCEGCGSWLAGDRFAVSVWGGESDSL